MSGGNKMNNWFLLTIIGTLIIMAMALVKTFIDLNNPKTKPIGWELTNSEEEGKCQMKDIIAWPVAYYFMKKWQQNFAYRIDAGMGIFIISGVIALIIALLTVSYQSIKAARANPVEALKYEQK